MKKRIHFFNWDYFQIKEYALNLSVENFEEALEYLEKALNALDLLWLSRQSALYEKTKEMYPGMHDDDFDPFAESERRFIEKGYKPRAASEFKIYIQIDRLYRILEENYVDQRAHRRVPLKVLRQTMDELDGICHKVDCSLPSFEYYRFGPGEGRKPVWKDPIKAGMTLTKLRNDKKITVTENRIHLKPDFSKNQWGAILRELRQLSHLSGSVLIEKYFQYKIKGRSYSELAGTVIPNPKTIRTLEKYCPYSKKLK